MPATDFGWSLDEKPPIFQVYGTKRKCSSKPEEETELATDSPKRRCLSNVTTISMETQPQIVSDHLSSCMPQQILADHSQKSLASPQTVPDNTLLTPAAQLENNNYISPSQPEVFHLQHHEDVLYSSQPGMVLEVAEEGDSGARLQTEDLSDTGSSMEAEESPELHKSQLAYCDKLCLGGNVSPTSHRVRCYCMPSWEGLTDGRQYFSDYY